MERCYTDSVGVRIGIKRKRTGTKLFLAACSIMLGALLTPGVVFGQPIPQDNLGIAVIVGKTHAWMLEAPEHWVLDPQGAAASGLGAAFYPSTQTWNTSPAVMYANAIVKTGDSTTVAHVMADDAQRATSRIPKTAVTEMAPIGTIQGVEARVCYFVKSDSSLFEAVAYIDCPTVVALVVLSARNGKDFHASLGAFARLVDSYEWITNDPSRISGMR